MQCLRCGAALPDAARFCPACGLAADAAVTVGATAQPTVTSGGPMGMAARRTPTPAGAPKSDSGWLSLSDSISHGRFAPGALLDGRYRIIGLLGRGGMGEVYRADDLRLGQPVALKFLPESLRNDPLRLAQFHNEVRTARQVSHPNVCRVYDVGEANGLLYLSMEYIDGEDLASSLRRIGRFPEDKAIEIAWASPIFICMSQRRGAEPPGSEAVNFSRRPGVTALKKALVRHRSLFHFILRFLPLQPVQSVFSPAARRPNARLRIIRATPRRWAKDILR